jgi:DNA-binding beta-propeller fold protein YncE
MRLIKVLLFTLSLAAFIPLPAEAASPVFGSVVAIGGSASDIALDESRGLLYIANFGGNTIQVMSTANNSIASSMNVLPWPGAIALSPDAQYLLVAHFCNLSTTSSTSTSTSTSSSTTTPVATSPACSNAITSIHLADQTQQVYSLASSPLAVAFLGTGQALIVTTTNILLLDPRTGQAKLVQTIASVASSLPVPAATFPSQILQASLSASADGKTIWGVAGAASSSASSSTSSSASSGGQLVFQYTGATNTISASLFVASPSLLPRISTASDGSYAMVGWLMIGSGMYVKARYPVTLQSSNLTGSAIDSANGLV